MPSNGHLENKAVADLRTPCLVVYKDVLQKNCDNMRAIAKKMNCDLRLHMKTAKTLEAGVIATNGTKRGITVSTIAEANFFGAGGFSNILYAVPLSGRGKVADCAELTKSVSDFHILVDNLAQLPPILEWKDESVNWSIYIMIDNGYHRDGIMPDNPQAVELAKRIIEAPNATLSGIYTHGGNSYDAEKCEKMADKLKFINDIGITERDSVVKYAEIVKKELNYEVPVVGVGSTPTCSKPPEHLDGVTEMHPGNFMYFDVMQSRIGACELSDIACAVVVTVTSHYPDQNKIMMDAGWTAITVQGAGCGYGAIEGCPDLRIKCLKQEAGEIESSDGSPIDFSKYPIGSQLRVLPYHSCAHTKCHDVAYLLETRTSELVSETWTICRGW